MALNTDSNDTRTYNFTTALEITRRNSPAASGASFPSETGNVFAAVPAFSIAYFFLAGMGPVLRLVYRTDQGQFR